ncbi:TetR family transcriptional regulator [Chryseobacterium piperi]|uniref:TetR family transcriptional regulator n=1 Tax=Chryseobacterium piperi TaxID=558152 RepID=A0A086BB13_9FLAO|nr:TetR/AcrR family transcriptional regulator [Chryseobacterium piperi]ASW75871.1 TetR/AcrR family transcriptional regulator [Chryseobacterium piperi]KFF26127.1 TetR family transcriptional regulator [Chryseobacterium piperi]
MRNRDLNKENIIKQKAIEIIVKDGLNGFTINKLAKACNISVGTPYVYYKDKDDLITKLVIEEGNKMESQINEGFDPDSSFEEGLRVQWTNRYRYAIKNPMILPFLEQINNSHYSQQFAEMFNEKPGMFMSEFKNNLLSFIANTVKRREIDEIPFEVYWSIAFAPLYTLLRFHQQGKSISGLPFVLTDELLWTTFDKVCKALKK